MLNWVLSSLKSMPTVEVRDFYRSAALPVTWPIPSKQWSRM